MKSPLVSIIVPVYNCEKYVAECLDSILRQTYENFELIVVNDGSTDGTANILEAYSQSDNRVNVIYQENRGLSGARNAALEICRGEYITMVDGDDFVADSYIEILLALAMETQADIVVAGSSSHLKRLGLRNETYRIFTPSDYVRQVLYKKLSDNSAWGRLYARRIWDNIRFSDLYYEDLEVFPKVSLRANKITFTPAKLYFYRNNNTSITRQFSQKKIDVLRAIESVIEIVSSMDASLLDSAQCRKLSANFNVFLITAGREEYKAINEQCWNTIKRMRKDFLFNREVVPKIKLGILVSDAGRSFLTNMNRILKVSS